MLSQRRSRGEEMPPKRWPLAVLARGCSKSDQRRIFHQKCNGLYLRLLKSAALALVCFAGSFASALTTELEGLNYSPKFPDAPLSRVGSTLRSNFGTLGLVVLAPKTKGASARSQPTFYWYLTGSTATDSPIEFVIQELGADEPLLETTLPGAHPIGIGSLALKNYGIKLESGKEYEWSIAVIIDIERRSHDIFSMGSIEYIRPEGILDNQLSQLPANVTVPLLVDAGYWYDALALIEVQREYSAADGLYEIWWKQLLKSQGIEINVAGKP